MHHATGTRLRDFFVGRCEQLVGSPTYLEAALLVERHLFIQCQEDGVALRQDLFNWRGHPSPRRSLEHEEIAMEQTNVPYDLKQLVRIFLLSQEYGKGQPGRGHKVTQTPRSPAYLDLVFAVLDPETILVLKGNKPLELRAHRRYRVVLYASDPAFLDAVLTDERGWRELPVPAMSMVVFRHEDLMEFSREPLEFIAQAKTGKF